MTVIAWDGKTLAADRRSCYGQMINTITKFIELTVYWWAVAVIRRM